MKIKNFNLKLKELVKLKSDIGIELNKIMEDESISIDDRFTALIESGLGGNSWRTNFDLNRDDEFLYEGPCYMEKYETSKVDDILDSLESDDEFGMTSEEIQTFKKYCVKNCYSTMKFDW